MGRVTSRGQSSGPEGGGDISPQDALGDGKVLEEERVKEEEWFEQRVGNGNKIHEGGGTIPVCLINVV